MKIIFAALIAASATTAALAQDATAPAAPPQPAKIYAEGMTFSSEKLKEYESRAKVVAELATAYGLNSQKNSPMSADEVNESVQTLADGNRIVRNSTTKFYRNSQGRIRREGSAATGDVFGTMFQVGQGVSIVNPVVGQKYLLDSQLKTARVIELKQGEKGLTITGSKAEAADSTPTVLEARKAKEMAEKLKTDKALAEVRAGYPLTGQIVPGFATTITSSGQGAFAFPNGVSSKYDTRSEELGIRDFEGVSAEGTRRTTTIPAGAIGNERPIEIVYERWFSKDLGMVVYSKNTDPRFGEQTYKLTNITRSEPDPSLFAVPTEYKKLVESGNLYRIATAPEAPKVAVPARPVSVSVPAKARP